MPERRGTQRPSPLCFCRRRLLRIAVGTVLHGGTEPFADLYDNTALCNRMREVMGLPKP